MAGGPSYVAPGVKAVASSFCAPPSRRRDGSSKSRSGPDHEPPTLKTFAGRDQVRHSLGSPSAGGIRERRPVKGSESSTQRKGQDSRSSKGGRVRAVAPRGSSNDGIREALPAGFSAKHRRGAHEGHRCLVPSASMAKKRILSSREPSHLCNHSSYARDVDNRLTTRSYWSWGEGSVTKSFSDSAYKFNLEEYMVTVDRPLGIRFALTDEGVVIVESLMKHVWGQSQHGLSYPLPAPTSLSTTVLALLCTLHKKSAAFSQREVGRRPSPLIVYGLGFRSRHASRHRVGTRTGGVVLMYC